MPFLLVLTLTSLTAVPVAPAAPLNVGLFRYRRSVQLSPSEPGISSLPLNPADLAAARPDLSDLILTSTDGRAVPFLVAPASVELTLALSKPSRGKGRSEYRVSLPVTPLRVDEIHFHIPDPTESFDRPFVLQAEVEGKPLELSAGRLFRKKGLQIPLSFAVDPLALTRLLLVVEDRELTPLEMSALSARAKVRILQVVAPQGDYFLWVGGPAGSPPPEISATAPQAVEARRGELETNLLFELREERRRLRTALWLVGAVALAGLLAWTARRLGVKSCR